MLAADLVVMPVTPGAADVWALQETVSALEEARILRPELRARALLNRSDRTTLSRLAQQAVGGLGVQLLDAVIGARVAFGEATLAGQGVVDYAPGSPAADEVRTMTAAALAVFQENHHEQEDRAASAGVPAPEAAAADPRGRAAGRAVHEPRVAPPPRSTSRPKPAAKPAAGKPAKRASRSPRS